MAPALGWRALGATSDMKLSQLLIRDLVLCPLTAADKWSAIETLARAAVRGGVLPEGQFASVLDALVAREKSMTTGMEKGIAIPHAAVDGIDDVIAVLGIAPAGVPFDALDDQPARIVVCLIIPRSKKLLHIKTLAEIARLLARAQVRQALLECREADAVLDTVRDLEREPA